MSRTFGVSPCVIAGLNYCTGDAAIYMDADLQDNPNEIPELYKMIVDDGYDIVSGWKKQRR